jgi:hypothetical protein
MRSVRIGAGLGFYGDSWLGATHVDVYPLDNLLALKIVLNAALSGGAARSLRSDNLGKTIGAAMLRLEIEIDATEAARLPRIAGEGA